MTLLIVFLTVTNIAVGYGLAIYLGHAQPPWDTVVGIDHPRSAAMTREDTRLTGSQEPDLGDAAPDPQDLGAPEPPPSNETGAQADDDLVAEEPAIEPNAGLAEPSALQAETEREESSAEPEALEQLEASSEETVEPEVEQEVLNSVETIREEVHAEPEPPTLEESLISDAVQVETENTSNDVAEEDVAEETEEQAEVSEADLLQGIGAFQEQLRKQQELSKFQPPSSEYDE